MPMRMDMVAVVVSMVKMHVPVAMIRVSVPVAMTVPVPVAMPMTVPVSTSVSMVVKVMLVVGVIWMIWVMMRVVVVQRVVSMNCLRMVDLGTCRCDRGRDRNLLSSDGRRHNVMVMLSRVDVSWQNWRAVLVAV